MSLIPANIAITFTANMAGAHRICYRIGNSGSYTCSEVTCESAGECTGFISVFVDNETCNTVTYNGYVQASCLPSDSPTDRVPFSVTFTPEPSCKAYTVHCAHRCVTGVNITSGGTGYTVGVSYSVSFIGGGGVASATAVVGSGALSSPVITNPGVGYNVGTYTNVAITGGSGSAAKATVVVAPAGTISSIVITVSGSGYTTTGPYSLNATDLGGSTPSVAVAFNATTDNGTIIGVTDLVCTASFQMTPMVLFQSGETTAEGTPVMEECSEIMTTGCLGDPVTIAAGTLALDESVVVCGYSTPAVDLAVYDVVESGNCKCSCTTATIGVTGSPGYQVKAYYNKCDEEAKSIVLTVGGSPSSIVDCIVPGSLKFLVITPGAAGSVSYGAACEY